MLAPRDRTTQILLGAADLIEERGWCQGKSQVDGRICAAAAITIAADYDYKIREQAGSKLLDVVGGSIIPDWNDKPGRTKDEVVAALRQAAFMAPA